MLCKILSFRRTFLGFFDADFRFGEPSLDFVGFFDCSMIKYSYNPIIAKPFVQWIVANGQPWKVASNGLAIIGLGLYVLSVTNFHF